jgi:hypothetical protein
MTKKEEKKIETKINNNLKKISKNARIMVKNFCNGSLAKGITAHQLAKALR